MIHLDNIIDKVLLNHPKASVDIIWNAYMICAKAHSGQKRLSGGAYLSHPLEVAYILADLKMDSVTIAAGLLHDIIEDTSMNIEELCEYFGDEIKQLVDGVTKLTKIKFTSMEERQAENFRKIILAMSKDIRVLIIKLADRLHNMRTLHHLPDYRRKKIARETLDIFAPLANRLGMGWIKYELEDIAFKNIWPEEYQAIKSKVAAKLKVRNAYVKMVSGTISQEMENYGIDAAIEGRPKHFYSISQKMQRQGISFDEVYDLAGIRIITAKEQDCYSVLGMIHSLWKPIPGRFKDYIALPKSNLYQSLHTSVIGPEGQRVEFQIRTEDMHEIADEGIAAHWQYKEGIVDPHYMDKINWLRELMEWQQELKDPREFMEAVKIDLFPDDVYVFTPQGDVKRLARGSTPIDFAYHIHTDIGHFCSGASVNGKIVPLKYELKSGDRVDILTSPNHKPSTNWLGIVKTSKASTKIKSWLKSEQRKLSVNLGKELASREFERHHLVLSKILPSPEFRDILVNLGFNSEEDILAAIGYGKLSVQQVFGSYLPETESHLQHKDGIDEGLNGTGIKIGGLFNQNILVRIAKCCNPVPGDPIVGFITRGRGLSVHATGCASVHKLEYNSERIIQVDWDNQNDIIYTVKISVQTMNWPGLLAKVTQAIASEGVNIKEAKVETKEDQKAYLQFILEITDRENLQMVITSINAIEGVLDVKRSP